MMVIMLHLKKEVYSSVSNDIKAIEQNMMDIDFAVDLKLAGQSFSMQLV